MNPWQWLWMQFKRHPVIFIILTFAVIVITIITVFVGGFFIWQIITRKAATHVKVLEEQKGAKNLRSLYIITSLYTQHGSGFVKKYINEPDPDERMNLFTKYLRKRNPSGLPHEMIKYTMGKRSITTLYIIYKIMSVIHVSIENSKSLERLLKEEPDPPITIPQKYIENKKGVITMPLRGVSKEMKDALRITLLKRIITKCSELLLRLVLVTNGEDFSQGTYGYIALLRYMNMFKSSATLSYDEEESINNIRTLLLKSIHSCIAIFQLIDSLEIVDINYPENITRISMDTIPDTLIGPTVDDKVYNEILRRHNNGYNDISTSELTGVKEHLEYNIASINDILGKGYHKYLERISGQPIFIEGRRSTFSEKNPDEEFKETEKEVEQIYDDDTPKIKIFEKQIIKETDYDKALRSLNVEMVSQDLTWSDKEKKRRKLKEKYEMIEEAKRTTMESLEGKRQGGRILKRRKRRG